MAELYPPPISFNIALQQGVKASCVSRTALAVRDYALRNSLKRLNNTCVRMLKHGVNENKRLFA